LKFDFDATGIGSVPFKDAKSACGIISENFTAIPFWPQLPKKSFLENMYIQFSEGLPGLVLDEAARNIYIDTSKVAETIEEVYGKYLEGDTEFFKIGRDRAAGFYYFLENFKNPADTVKFVKGQITGPVSFALSVTDQNKRSIIYDKDLFEVLTKTLVMKAKWQIKRLKKIFPHVMIFIDEPYLVSIGSSYVNIDAAAAFEKLDALIGAVKAEGVLAGIHCCGNTDWGLVLKRDIDILNFDAYNFTRELFIYTNELREFLKKGGTIAWGIIPSAEAALSQTKKSMRQRFDAAISDLSAKRISPDEVSSIITPSCGAGTLDEETASKVFYLTSALSGELRKK
jgi:hypothetical protein